MVRGSRSQLCGKRKMSKTHRKLPDLVGRLDNVAKGSGEGGE